MARVFSPFLRLVPACLAIVALGACMSSEREEALQASVREMDKKMVELERQVLTRDRALESIRTNSDESSRRVQASKNEMEDVRRQLALTQGAVDELRVKLSRLQEGGGGGHDGASLQPGESDGVARLERKLAKMELMQDVSVDKKPKGGAVPKFKSGAEVAKSLKASLEQKDVKKVVTTASALIYAEVPEDQVEAALGYRAEAYFAQQDFGKAAIDLISFLERFPRSERRPRALLLAGDSFVYLKRFDSARSFYAECVRVTPERDECKASKERLDKLGG